MDLGHITENVLPCDVLLCADEGILRVLESNAVRSVLGACVEKSDGWSSVSLVRYMFGSHSLGVEVEDIGMDVLNRERTYMCKREYRTQCVWGALEPKIVTDQQKRMRTGHVQVMV
jgi:hypothetical protein